MGDPIPWPVPASYVRSGPERQGFGIREMPRASRRREWPADSRALASPSAILHDLFGHFMTLRVTITPVPPVTLQPCPTTGH